MPESSWTRTAPPKVRFAIILGGTMRSISSGTGGTDMVGSGERREVVLVGCSWWLVPTRFPIARFACRKTLAPDRYMGGMGRRMRTYGGTFDWKPSQPRPAKFRKQRVECPAPGAEVRRKAFRKFGSRSHCREATFLFLFVYNFAHWQVDASPPSRPALFVASSLSRDGPEGGSSRQERATSW